MSAKKVIIIGPAHPYRGGIANFNNSLAKAFKDNKDDVQVYSFKLQYPSFLFPGKTQYEESEPPKGVKIKSAINSINPFNWINVSRSINDEKPDYVVIRYWLPFMAPCLGFIARVLYSNIKGSREHVGDAALLLDLNDPNSLVENLEKLLNSNELRSDLVNKGQAKYKQIISHNNRNNYDILKNIIENFKSRRECWK